MAVFIALPVIHTDYDFIYLLEYYMYVCLFNCLYSFNSLIVSFLLLSPDNIDKIQVSDLHLIKIKPHCLNSKW